MPPLIDPSRTPLAFGHRALPRLNKELQDTSLLLRQRALRSLSDHLHDPEHIAEAIDVGITERLNELLQDANDTVRELVTDCLQIMASHAVGRDAFIVYEVIPNLARLFHDDVSVVRRNTHLAIRNLSETNPGASAVVEQRLVHVLVIKLKEEHDEIKALILDTLHFLLHVDTEVALHCGAMDVFTALLEHKLPDIRAKAARDIMDLSVPLDGKKKAVECDTLPSLVKLLKDKVSDVRASAASAIMFITVTTTGKVTAIECGALGSLVDLVDDRTSEVRLNAIKALTCLSEAPDGRAELLKHVEMIRNHECDHIPAVVKAAKRAVEVITWQP